MHNIKDIRDNPELFKKILKKRFLEINIDNILELDKENRKLIQDKENLEKEKKDISKSKNKSLFEKSKTISNEIEKLSQSQKTVKNKLDEILCSLPNLPKADRDYRFFEMGNHFSENIFVRYCTFDEVDKYLPEFREYLETYRKIVDEALPTGEDTSFYGDFDTYMKKLDPILGYMTSIFGKEKADLMMDDFFFSYAQ